MSIQSFITEGFGLYGSMPEVLTEGLGYPRSAEEEAEIVEAIRNPPVDFIIVGNMISGRVSPLKRAVSEYAEKKRAEDEMKEMVAMYYQWKIAA